MMRKREFDMKKKAINTAKHRFTLVELLVSMGVLVVILGFILQFFIGSQRLWQSMEQRNNLYADARVAMDLMTTMLQNSFYSEGGIPFRIDRSENYRHKIYFATQTMQNLPGGKLKYVSFQLGNREPDSSSTSGTATTGEWDELKLAVFCDQEADEFSKYFPPYGLEGAANLTEARSGVISKLDGQLRNSTRDPDVSEPYGSVLVRHVTSFEIVPYALDIDATDTSKWLDPVTETQYDEFPYMVVLKLTMLSPADFKIWMEMKDTYDDDGNPGEISSSDNARVQFRKTHAYTFARTVFIGEQSRMNIND